MKEQEKRLFKELCKAKGGYFDDALLSSASPSVLGQLFYNRMQGVAYDRLKKQSALAHVNREFRNSLKYAYEQNKERNISFFKCVALVRDALASCNCKVAMLKGAVLCAYYPEGCRTSNDIDLLVHPYDVTMVGRALLSAGFCQGNIRDDVFFPASRRDIVESKMMRGETVPFVKAVNLPSLQYIEVDINFSVDYKNNMPELVSDLLRRGVMRDVNGLTIPTLDTDDFFIHLCAHLYKEATTFPWIVMHRDMTLYKYCDIYMLLMEMTEEDIARVFMRARELDIDKVCAYAISETMSLFDIDNAFVSKIIKEFFGSDDSFLRRVISPNNSKILMYRTSDATKRFFMSDRTRNLIEEVKNE